jgi:uncharacterized damage-inducible protein DinB
MEENRRIAKLFQDLYNGDPWLDVTIKATLSRLTAAEAAARVMDKCNTIWEIVNHLIAWRKTVKARIMGHTIKSPDNNYFQEIRDTSDQAWSRTLQEFDASQDEWVEFLLKLNDADLQKPYLSGQMTNYDLILGINQHDAYHLGQIVILAKQGRK